MLDKKYNHTEVEKNKYEEWMEKGYFMILLMILKRI